MKPVLQENRIHKRLWFLYLIIFIICTMGIGVALYLQYYQDEKIGLTFGIKDADSEQEDEYNELKSEFPSIFDNKIDVLQESIPTIEKIKNDYELVATVYSYTQKEENYSLDVYIPYINAKTEIAAKYNQNTRKNYKEKADEILKGSNIDNIIYTVTYKAYLQNNILSLIIRSELKEGNKSQKITIETYNYDIVNEREVTLEELLNLKNITKLEANEKIKNEMNKIKEQNQALIDQGYKLYQRDYASNIYNVDNTTEYFIGNDGMIYIIYAYGNTEYTSEMDIIIFK